MIRYSGLVIASAALLASFAANAAEDDMGGFVGAGVGYARIESEDFLTPGNDFRDDRTTWQVYGGFTFTPYLGLEAGYINFGETEDNGGILDTDGFSAGLGLYLPMTDTFTLSARAGQLWWDAQASFDDIDDGIDAIDFETDGEDPFYGVGAHFGDGDGLGFAIRYDRYELDEVDIDVPSVNLELGF